MMTGKNTGKNDKGPTTQMYSLSVAGKQACGYNETTKAIAKYVGHTYGHKMKCLVMNRNDSAPVEPAYPEGDDPLERGKAVWSKRYDQFLREQRNYNDDKAKVFTIVYGKCDKAMKNRIESQGTYASVEATNDVVGLLQLIKDAAYDSNEKKYPPMQAAMALKRLMMMRQYGNEDVIDYYKRFSSTLEMVDRAYGEIAPTVLAQRDQAYKNDAEGVCLWTEPTRSCSGIL
eukprot:scaffold9572_cov157-Amphora_coffeaeformis.AAC.5